jgi:hypothetical protein
MELPANNCRQLAALTPLERAGPLGIVIRREASGREAMRISKRVIRGAPQGATQILGLHLQLAGAERQVALASVFSDGRQPAVRLLELPPLDLTVQELSALSDALRSFAAEIVRDQPQESAQTAVSRSKTGGKPRSFASSLDRLMGAGEERSPTRSEEQPQAAAQPGSLRAKPGKKQ